MSIISYTDDFKEADEIIWSVQRFYEMASLRMLYYYPIFALLCLGIACTTFALLMYAIYWLNEWRE